MQMLARSSLKQHTTILTWFRTKVGFVEVARSKRILGSV